MIRPGDSLPTAYKKALRMYQEKKYSDAAKAFSTVTQVGRGTDYAKNAYFFEAQAYYKSDQYLLAAAAYERYTSLYPQANKAEQADYKDALCYYNLSPRYNIDQKYTNKAIEKFQIYISDYPNSDKDKQAGKYISQLRSKLAHKTFHAAHLYRKLDEFKATIIYYNLTIDQYPESSWAEKALAEEIDTYDDYASKSIRSKERVRYQKAISSYEKYIQLFPKGKDRPAAEKYVDVAREALHKLKSSSAQTNSKKKGKGLH